MSHSTIAVRGAGEAAARRVDEPWGSLTWLANSELGGARLTLGRVVIKQGESNPRHSHANCQEVLYLLCGRLEHQVGEQWVTLNAGDTLVVEAGVAHCARSVGEQDAEMIVAYDSGRREFRPEPLV